MANQANPLGMVRVILDFDQMGCPPKRCIDANPIHTCGASGADQQPANGQREQCSRWLQWSLGVAETSLDIALFDSGRRQSTGDARFATAMQGRVVAFDGVSACGIEQLIGNRRGGGTLKFAPQNGAVARNDGGGK
jgi:hypothetical protein